MEHRHRIFSTMVNQRAEVRAAGADGVGDVSFMFLLLA
jgi:hypothetical protein